jgi:uncharacterized membrane protein YfcA
MFSKFQSILAGYQQPAWGLAGLVLMIAFLYSSVGFGGASGYLAVMAWFEISPNIAVSTALTLNLIVTGISFINYYRGGHYVPELLWPFAIASIPAAFIGGTVHLGQVTYLAVLHMILFIIAIRMLTAQDDIGNQDDIDPPAVWVTLLIGAGLGLLAGMIGIGGGIFLSPLIILAKWGNPKHAAVTAAGFIFLNSLSGLIGRVLVGAFEFGSFGLFLIPVGVVGSLIGSRLGARYLSGSVLKRLLGIILLIAVIRFIVES